MCDRLTYWCVSRANAWRFANDDDSTRTVTRIHHDQGRRDSQATRAVCRGRPVGICRDADLRRGFEPRFFLDRPFLEIRFFWKGAIARRAATTDRPTTDRS